MPPVDPQPTTWRLPSPALADRLGIVGVGADLEPGTLLAAYRSGIFPMPVEPSFGNGSAVAWWSPDPRGVLLPDRMRVSRSLRQSARRYGIRVDTAFADVVRACADPGRPGGWITDDIREAYVELNRLGWAHSVEAWTPDGRLAGGLYGVAVGGLFAGESMFRAEGPWSRDASKVALLALVTMMQDGVPGRLLDVQWVTPHLASLGAVDVPRHEYLNRLTRALELPLPAELARCDHTWS